MAARPEHLPPPAATPRVRFDRYSVYHEQARPAGPDPCSRSARCRWSTRPGRATWTRWRTSSPPSRTAAAADHPDAHAAVTANPGYPRGHRGGPRLARRPTAAANSRCSPWRPGGRAGDHRHPGLRPHPAPAADRAGPGRAARLRQAPRPARLAESSVATGGLTASRGRDRRRCPPAARRPARPADGRPAGGRGAPRPGAGRGPAYSEFPGGHVVAGRRDRGDGGAPCTDRAASGAVQASWLDNQALIGPPHQLHLDEPLAAGLRPRAARYVVNFETYGTLSAARDNAILVCHSLTSRAHAAGRHAPERPAARLVGRGDRARQDARYRALLRDLRRHAGRGPAAPGPASPDPETGRPLRAPLPGYHGAGHGAAQRPLVQRLGIERLHAVSAAAWAASRRVEWAIIGYPGPWWATRSSSPRRPRPRRTRSRYSA